MINIDYPNQTEDYIHRIGRTARSTNTGTAYTFLTHDNARHVPKLIEVMREANQFVSDELMAMSRGRGGYRSAMPQSESLYFLSFIDHNNIVSSQCSHSSSASSSSNKGSYGGYGGSSSYGAGGGGGGSSSYGSSSRGGYNSGGGGGGGDAYGPSEARKRDSSSLNDYGAPASSTSSSYSNGGVKRPADDGTRVKKFRWDQGPTMNDSGSSSSSSHANGHSHAADSGSNIAYRQPVPPPASVASYSSGPVRSSGYQSAAAPPPPPPTSSAAAPPRPSGSMYGPAPVANGQAPPPPPLPQANGTNGSTAAAPAASAYQTAYDYNTAAYNLQYYQAIAAAAAANGSSWQQAAVPGATGSAAGGWQSK